MKSLSIQRCFSMILVVVLSALSGGCRPSVEEVVDLLKPVPVGASREEVRDVLVQAYGKKYPDWKQSYGLTDPPHRVTSAILEAERTLLVHNKRDHRYVRVYPENLFENMPPGALTESIGIVAEAAHGNGSVSIYYDSNTNYLGFFAFASGMDR